METILASVITGSLALAGTVLTVRSSSRKTEQTLRTELAVMNNEMTNLRREVEKHNNFAERIPKLEVQTVEAERRLQTLENFHME